MSATSRWYVLRIFEVLVGTSLVAPPAAAQTVTCEPAEQRAGREYGCFVTARAELGALPRDSALYWHIDAFSTRSAADAARTSRSTVVSSLGRIWLFTIAESGWRPLRGDRVAMAGRLPLIPADSYAAVYMEGVFRPGMHSPVHRHPGVEVWHTLQGEQCLETPDGKLTQRHEASVDARHRLEPGRTVSPVAAPPGTISIHRRSRNAHETLR
jgi:hypothetical protein